MKMPSGASREVEMKEGAELMTYIPEKVARSDELVFNQGPPPLFPLSECLGCFPKLQPYVKFFGPTVLASYNFIPIKYIGSFGELYKLSLPTPEQPVAQQRLIIRDKTMQSIRSVALTQNEARSLLKMIPRTKSAWESDIEIFIYDKTIGFIQQTRGADCKAVEKDIRFQEQMVMLDIFDGDFDLPAA